MVYGMQYKKASPTDLSLEDCSYLAVSLNLICAFAISSDSPSDVSLGTMLLLGKRGQM